MKRSIYLSLIILASCGGPTADPVVTAGPLKEKIEAYCKSKTNNPEKYEPGAISDKTLVTDTNLIMHCYSAKYGVEVSFDKPTKSHYVQDVHEKFYSVSNSFKAQNNSGAIVKHDVQVYFDSSEKILFALELQNR